jgi:hypothetical protein
MAVSVNLPGSIKVLNPFPLDYWRGPWANLAAAKAGVPLGARFDGLKVKITGDGEYWWLAADLTDTGLVPVAFNATTQSQNLVFAGPASGAAAVPTFRSLVLNDIPSLSSLYLPIAGGTLTGNLILNADPVTGLGAATKNYVDGIASGLSWKNAVDVATTGDITLSGEQTIDGVLTSASDVLVWNQADATENGIYVSAAGAWSRRTDSNTGVEIVGSAVAVLSGTLYNNTRFVYTGAASITIGVDDINYTIFDSGGTYTAGTGIDLTGNVFSIDANGVTNALFRQSAAVSVVGRSANSTGDVADIAAASNYQIFRRSGDALAFGSIDLSQSTAVGASVLGIANGGTGLSALGSANQLLRVNAGATALEYFTPSYLTTLTDGNGTTANGSAADLGGLLTGNVLLQDDVLSTDRYFNIKLGDRAGFTLPYAEFSMSYDGSGDTRSILLEVGNQAQDNLSSILIGAGIDFSATSGISFNDTAYFNGEGFALNNFTVRTVTIGSPEPARGFSVKNNASGGADAALGSAIGFAANRVFYDSYAEIIHTTDGAYGDGGGYHGTFIFNDMGSLYSGFPIPGIEYAKFGVNGYTLYHSGTGLNGTSNIQSQNSGSNNTLLTIESGENTFSKTGSIEVYSYGGTTTITATDGVDTSVLTLTKDVIKLLPGSGAPTVGDVWTATNIDGSGEWASPSGGGWPFTGTGTLTGNVLIDGTSTYNVEIGGTGTELGTFGVRTVGNINLFESIGGASMLIQTSGSIYLSATGTLRLGDGGGPFIDLDGSTGQFAHSGTGSNAGLSFPKGLFSNTSNQLTLGTTRTVTITAPTPATTDRVWTIPDLSGDMTFVGLTGTQTLTNKTLGTGTVFSVIPTINDGITFTFNPNATVSGLNVGAHTADPSSPVNGDVYYDSTNNLLRARINSAWVSLGAGGGGITIGTTTITSGTNTRILYNNSGVVGEYSIIPVALGGTNIASYAVGDLLQATASTTLSKLASVSAGSFLRSGGVTTASAWSTVKLPDTMSALGIWVANTANTAVNLTVTANQSIRMNAGGTAWEAYTPSGGIGGSTGATDNSVLRADGTGGATLQNSAVFIQDDGDIDIGTDSGTGRNIQAAGSGTNVFLQLLSKGTGVVAFSTTNTTLNVNGTTSGLAFSNQSISTFNGSNGTTGNSGWDLIIRGGNAYSGDGTPLNGGHLYLNYGAKNTTGLDGNIGLNTSSVADWQDMERGVYLANRGVAPTAGIANGVALFAEDSNSSSEFYVMPESGAKVNISGLFEPVTESGTTITLNETHRNKIVLCSNSGVVTVTVGSGKAAGWNCMLVATHATGTITLSASGTTLNGTTTTTTQFETLSLVHYGSENYLSKLG